MREILFRGKDFKEEWKFGNFIRNTHFGYIIQDEESINRNFIVYQESIGQYTGLKDRNGTRIFDGDIVEVPMYRSGQETLVRGLVIYEKGSFSIEWFCRNYGKSFLGYIDDIQVIGNEFDNPELLPN